MHFFIKFLISILFIEYSMSEAVQAQGMMLNMAMWQKKDLADLTPDALDWTNILRPSLCDPHVDGNTQTILGISQPIDLEIEFTGQQVEYRLNGGLWNSLVEYGVTNLYVIVLGTTIQFRANMAAGGTVTIKNISDGNTTLDSFLVSPGGPCL